MSKSNLLTLLVIVIPNCQGKIPEELYWECIAEGIDPEIVYECIKNNDFDTLTTLFNESESEDLLDRRVEDLFRLEVLQDLEASGIEYEDGSLYVQAEIHNS